MKLRTAAMATALVAATLPALPTSAHAFGFHHGGWGWGGVGLGLATGALVGAALATPYYGAYAYDYGYPAYAPAYGYDYGYAPAYAYDYGYAPSYGYASYAYGPSYSVTYSTPSWGYRHYAYRRYGYRHYATTYGTRYSTRAAYASYRPGYVRATHIGSMHRAYVRR
jgi:hypothetical protein